MKTWKLESQQHVSVDLHRNVYFRHCSDNPREIVLSWRQFLNLNDIVRDLETFNNMKYYPLGNHIWLQYYNNRIQLYHRLKIYLTFHNASWCRYLKKTHRNIQSFLRHGARRLHGRKHAAVHETLFKGESRNITSTPSKQQVLSRETSNVIGENEQWTKYSNLPKRDSTDSGCSYSFIGAVNALRTATDATSDMEEGEVCDIKTDGGELSNFCTIE